MSDKNAKTTSMADRVRQRAQTHKSQGGLDTLNLPEGVEFFKAEKGTVEFDIIPYRVTVDTHPEVSKGEIWYERTYLMHRNIGPEEKAVVCPRTVGKKCPICEEYQRLNKDPDADEDIVAGLKAKERELFNVVTKEGDGSIMILDISVFLFGLLLEQEILEGDESNASFAELKGGKTLKVRWDSKTMGTNKFVEASRIDFVYRDDFDEDVLDAAVDLDKALKILSYEEIELIFRAGSDEGEVVEKDEPSDDDKKPSRRTIGNNRTPKKDEPEDNLDMGTDKPGKTDDDGCIACDGTGKTSKGKDCPICGGTGKNDNPSDDKGENPPEEKPAGRKIGRGAPEEKSGKRSIRR